MRLTSAGFYRTEQRLQTIKRYVDEERTDAAQLSLKKAIVKLSLQLEQLILPFWKICGRTGSLLAQDDRKALFEIVSIAADLSRWLRRVPHTVYYWPPTFKDEEFEPARMECLNLEYMTTHSPYNKKGSHGRERAELAKGEEARGEAIVRVVCFPGLVAYRQGGGALAQQLLEDESARPDHAPPDVKARERLARRGADALTGNEGFRTKIICKSVVHLVWGKQRLLTREAGTSAHIDAMRDQSQKYENDYQGFKELYDIFRERTPQPEDVPNNRGENLKWYKVGSWGGRGQSAEPPLKPGKGR